MESRWRDYFNRQANFDVSGRKIIDNDASIRMYAQFTDARNGSGVCGDGALRFHRTRSLARRCRLGLLAEHFIAELAASPHCFPEFSLGHVAQGGQQGRAPGVAKLRFGGGGEDLPVAPVARDVLNSYQVGDKRPGFGSVGKLGEVTDALASQTVLVYGLLGHSGLLLRQINKHLTRFLQQIRRTLLNGLRRLLGLLEPFTKTPLAVFVECTDELAFAAGAQIEQGAHEL